MRNTMLDEIYNIKASKVLGAFLMHMLHLK